MQESTETRALLSATFTLQTLTPLFIAGADQETAELRPPSFRGLMRYWQRALVGGLVGTDSADLKQVIEQESQVFGTTDSGSPIRLRLNKTSHTHKPIQLTELRPKYVNGNPQATGKGYLIWSMAKSGSEAKKNFKPARHFYPEGTEFEISLLAQPRHKEEYAKALAAFWLMTHLGGIGSRSRRTAGSLLIKNPQGDTGQLPFEQAATFEALKQQLEAGIKAARKLFTVKGNPPQNALFDALAPATCRIWLIQGKPKHWHTAEDAMTALGESLQEHRGSFPLSERTIFGLPLQKITNRERMASPLHLCLTKLKDGQYVGIAVLFKTRTNITSLTPTDTEYKRIESWLDPTNRNVPGKVTEIML